MHMKIEVLEDNIRYDLIQSRIGPLGSKPYSWCWWSFPIHDSRLSCLSTYLFFIVSLKIDKYQWMN